jgi:hypothetical protein
MYTSDYYVFMVQFSHSLGDIKPEITCNYDMSNNEKTHPRRGEDTTVCHLLVDHHTCQVALRYVTRRCSVADCTEYFRRYRTTNLVRTRFFLMFVPDRRDFFPEPDS